MQRSKVNATPSGALEILKDGGWHPTEELVKWCGSEGGRRARELREPRWGKFNVKCYRNKNGVHGYQISSAELLDKADVVERVLAGCQIRDNQDPVDEIKYVPFTVRDLVFLLATLTNNPHLNNPQVKNLWERRRAALITMLYDRLPEDITDPFDLFEDADDEE